MQRYFATACSKITRFSPKCSEINWQYEEWANLIILIEYSLFGSW